MGRLCLSMMPCCVVACRETDMTFEALVNFQGSGMAGIAVRANEDATAFYMCGVDSRSHGLVMHKASLGSAALLQDDTPNAENSDILLRIEVVCGTPRPLVYWHVMVLVCSVLAAMCCIGEQVHQHLLVSDVLPDGGHHQVLQRWGTGT